MTTKELLSHLKDIPEIVQPPVIMKEPNEVLSIYEGIFKIKNGNHEYDLSGNIKFYWFPDLTVRVHGKFLRNEAIAISIGLLEEFDTLIDGQIIGTLKITDIDFSGDAIMQGNLQRCVLGESNIAVDEVLFCIPNLRDFTGASVKSVSEKNISLHNNRLELKDGPFVVYVDKLVDYTERHEKLQNKGGFIIEYSGKIIKKKGPITLAEIQKWERRLHHFLYFLNGRRTAPMFYTGMFQGEKIWTEYSGPTIDIYKYTPSWSNIVIAPSLSTIWKMFNDFWQEDIDRDFLITAIHWYTEANSNAAMVEGSIILIQTALELIYNWLIVENKQIIIGNDADNISAANKMRLILSQLNISSDIPPAFQELKNAAGGLQGPEAFVKIRNALVHGQETKRAELMKISLMAKYQALQLGIWYVELAMLKILEYNENYNDRTSANNWRDTGVKVPWSI